jgi:hypothetical protein
MKVLKVPVPTSARTEEDVRAVIEARFINLSVEELKPVEGFENLWAFKAEDTRDRGGRLVSGVAFKMS